MTAVTTPRPGPTITVRRPSFDFSSLPERWVGGSRLGTAFGNAGHVFIPLGEQFFIDTVRQFRNRVTDERLAGEVRSFIGQEAVHRRAHEQLWATLEERGVPVERYAELIDSVRSIEEHLPATFRLSVTAALEHYTAAFGHSFLTEDLSSAVPDEMARLLAWHGLEELEHRAVAFEVLQTVDDRYALRVAGFGFASLLFVAVPAVGAVMFSLADRRQPEPVPSVPDQPRDPRLRGMTVRLMGRMAGHLASYLRPGFHPLDLDVPPEAERWAAAMVEPEVATAEA